MNATSGGIGPESAPRTLVVVLELSQSSWLAAGVVPGLARRPLKKLAPEPELLLQTVERWRADGTRRIAASCRL
jgi:transposase